jgi:hypothetical protein
MKTIWIPLGALGFLSGAAFLIFWLLAWSAQVPPGEPLILSCGLMLLVTGLFLLRAAADKTADRGTWARSNVKIGRLSGFALGTFFFAIGAAFVGSLWLPRLFGLGGAAVALASFALAWFGTSRDERRAREKDARTKPDGQGADPCAAPERGGGS